LIVCRGSSWNGIVENQEKPPQPLNCENNR
jgi:hypothetical protein